MALGDRPCQPSREPLEINHRSPKFERICLTKNGSIVIHSLYLQLETVRCRMKSDNDSFLALELPTCKQKE